jgi:hypothetical protein
MVLQQPDFSPETLRKFEKPRYLLKGFSLVAFGLREAEALAR